MGVAFLGEISTIIVCRTQFVVQRTDDIVGAVIDRPCGIISRIRPNLMRIRYIFLPGD